MEQAGFPWLQAASNNPIQDHHDRQFSEKTVEPEPEPAPAPAPAPALSSAPNDPSKPAATNGDLEKSSQVKRGALSQSKKRTSANSRPPPVRPLVKSHSDPKLSGSNAPLPVRTIPPWVQDADEADLDDIEYPDTPHDALIAHHNHSPAATRRPLLSGKQPDHGQRPTSSGQDRSDRASRWISFGRASAYPRENFTGNVVTADWLNQNWTDYSKPWLADHNEDDEENSSTGMYRAFRSKKRVWHKRAQFIILRNPFIPLAFRFTVFAFALTAIGLGASIYNETGKIASCVAQAPGTRDADCAELVGQGPQDYYRDPSALMAIIVDAIALVYTICITYDEYFSKPLGLRPAHAKVRLVLLDLFFVVFQSANLSLSFESLTVDDGACQLSPTSNRFENVCDRAQALSAVLLVSLTAWLMTFSVSVLRLVEKMNVTK